MNLHVIWLRKQLGETRGAWDEPHEGTENNQSPQYGAGGAATRALPMLGVRAEARDRGVDGQLERRGFAIDGNSRTFGHQVIGDGGANFINLANYEPVELYAVNTPLKGLCNTYAPLCADFRATKCRYTIDAGISRERPFTRETSQLSLTTEYQR
jgi:hypothetical protein